MGKILPTKITKVLLLEGIHPVAAEKFKQYGFEVEQISGKLEDDELKKKLKEVNIIGVRSKTKLSPEVLDCAENLLCIGSYTKDAQQTNYNYAMKIGIPVFASPFAHARSVAELILAEMIALSRMTLDHTLTLHKKGWKKTATGCFEVRGKTLGIIGYGHVGSQLSVMAESFGMNVLFYDIRTVLAHGNATSVSLEQLLSSSNFISLHATDIKENSLMIGEKEFKTMKKGTFFLNASAGKLVDYDALAEAIKSKHIAGCAIDAHINEPLDNGDDNFDSPLRNLKNTILTPHIGGGTQEGQEDIGNEVTEKIINYVKHGMTVGTVNFPVIDIERNENSKVSRIVNIHQNVPGVLKNLNNLLTDSNVEGQYLGVKSTIGYCVIDVSGGRVDEIVEAMSKMETVLTVRNLDE